MRINRLASIVAALATGWVCIGLTTTIPESQPQPQAGDPVRGLIESLRADLRGGKVKTINQVMRLSDSEAAKFWPIYHDYENELFELGDQRLTLINDYLKLHASGALTSDKAKELTEAFFKFQSDRLDLMKKYEALMRENVSALRAAEFVQIENRFSLVIDLMIASQIPLVGEASSAAK